MNFVDNPIPNMSNHLPLGLALFLTGNFWQQSFPTSLSSKTIILVHFIYARFHIHSILKLFWSLFMVFLNLQHRLCKIKKAVPCSKSTKKLLQKELSSLSFSLCPGIIFICDSVRHSLNIGSLGPRLMTTSSQVHCPINC